MEALRKMAVSGLFYPGDCIKVTEMIRTFNHQLERSSVSQEDNHITPRALIIPHAGYIYSGYTANIAYHTIRTAKPKRIIVIGPSHKYYFQGISGSFYEAYQTPCGNLNIDSAYLFALSQRFHIGFVPQAHAKEHATEVQMPLIHFYFPHAQVIELIYGEVSENTLANMMTAMIKNPENLLVISSDLSHFYPLKKAEGIDLHCIDGVTSLETTKLAQCEACGLRGIKAIILAARHLKLSSRLLHYTTSADYSHDTQSVVGYMSALFYQ